MTDKKIITAVNEIAEKTLNCLMISPNAVLPTLQALTKCQKAAAKTLLILVEQSSSLPSNPELEAEKQKILALHELIQKAHSDVEEFINKNFTD